MNRNVIILAAITMLLSFGYGVKAQENKDGLVWYTDAQKAAEVSNKLHKPIFGFFTGSDWCGWCKKLQAAVFQKQEFKQWAANNVVLLELDFPRMKKLPDELMAQNNSLQQAFQVQGYPTVWLFYIEKDAAANKFNINALGSLGYPQSQPGQEATAFVQTATNIIKSKK